MIHSENPRLDMDHESDLAFQARARRAIRWASFGRWNALRVSQNCHLAPLPLYNYTHTYTKGGAP